MDKKFVGALLLPMIVTGAIVLWLTQSGLNNNVRDFSDSLRIQSQANLLLPYLLIQDDATKAMMLNEDQFEKPSSGSARQN